MVLRLDLGELGAPSRTPQGGLRIPATIARVGVLEYQDSAGNVWREFRPPEEAFRAESLASLRGAPVTDGHPPTLVNTDNFREYSRGHVGDDVRREGDFVAGSVVVNDSNLVRAIAAGERRDISAGYECELDPTPGSYGGQTYQAVQRNVRMNHAALLPRGQGRAGTDVGLRMDGAAVLVTRHESKDTAASNAGTENPMKIKFAGKEYRTDDAGEMASLQSDADATMAKKDADVQAKSAQVSALMEQIATLLTDVAKLKAVAEAEEASEGAMDADAEPVPEDVLDAAGIKRDPKRPLRVSVKVMDELVARREALRADARKVLGDEFDFAGKSTAEIQRAVIAKIAPKMRLDSLDAKALGAAFEGVVSAYVPRNDALGKVNEAANGDASAKREDSLDDAYARLNKREIERGQKPLATR